MDGNTNLLRNREIIVRQGKELFCWIQNTLLYDICYACIHGDVSLLSKKRFPNAFCYLSWPYSFEHPGPSSVL